MTNTINNTRIQELTQTHIAARQEYDIQTAAIAAEQAKARTEYESKTAELNKQLQAKISDYNHVVRNTLSKFGSDSELVNALTQQLVIFYGSTFLDFDAHSKEYIFDSKGVQQRVSISLLQNDPIAVARYTRRMIRQFQAGRRQRDYNNAKSNLTSAKSALTRQRKAVETTQLILDNAELFQKKYEARLAKRLMRKQQSQTKN